MSKYKNVFFDSNFSNCILLVLCLMIMHLESFAQNLKTDSAKTSPQKISSLADFANQSKWTFRSRSFFMTTVNNGSLKDDYTLAQGAGLGLVTVPVKGVQLGFSGYFIFNVFSSDLATADKITGAFNRYEIGQYDVTNAKNKTNLSRYEDLYLKYTYKKNNIIIGRMDMNTPFINAQDGRMRPTYVEGAAITLSKNEKYSFDGSYVWRIMPRSTYQYYLLQDATGLYGQGLNTDGSKSDYRTNITTKGFFTSHFFMNPIKKFQVNIWSGYFENVMHTGILELKNESGLNEKSILYYGLMYVRQDAINDGGNKNQSKTYINKGAQSTTLSTQAGLKTIKFNANVNYTHITNDGRYLMPREWGRDPFYTFMPRERNEGAGAVNAITTNFTYFMLNQKLKAGLGYGYFLLPKVSNFALNKYGMPSYHQVNLSAGYQFQKFWKGMELRLLAAGKIKDGKETLAPKYIYNKVNMVNFNLVLDFKI